jgi:hypothetical protein
MQQRKKHLIFNGNKESYRNSQKEFYKNVSNQEFDHEVNGFDVSMTATH